MFLQACVCLQGGVPDQVHTPGQVHTSQAGTPPTRYTPQAGTPLDQVHPPRPGTHPPRPGTHPLDQVHPRNQVHPPGPGTPPGTRYTPRDTATAADRTHPTGMHSCRQFNYIRSSTEMHSRLSLCISQKKPRLTKVFAMAVYIAGRFQLFKMTSGTESILF